MKNNIELLKPCPFCGKSAKLSAGISDMNGDTFYYVRCKGCSARGKSYTDSQIRDGTGGAAAAIRAWNRRTDSRTFPAAETPEKAYTRPYYPESGSFFPDYRQKDAAELDDVKQDPEQEERPDGPESSEDPDTTPAADPEGMHPERKQDPATTPAEDPAEDEKKNDHDAPADDPAEDPEKPGGGAYFA